MATTKKRGSRGNPKATRETAIKASENTRFSAINQPTPEQKRNGHLKAKRGQELVAAILQMKYKGAKDGALLKSVAEYFDVDAEEITIEMMMHFRQIEKAVAKNDASAYQAIISRAHGQPKQPVDFGVTDDFMTFLTKTGLTGDH